MILKKLHVFSFFLGVDLLASILELTNTNFLGIGTLLSFCTSLLVPGVLISLILRIKKLSLWENLLLIVGLSIVFLEFGGLLLNILLPLFGIQDPLTLQNLVFGFDVYSVLLFVFAWIRTEQITIKIQMPSRSRGEKVLYVLPLFFPVLGILGAIMINNRGSNILTLILLGSIALYSLLLVVFRARIAVDLYPYAIFFIGMASLFTTSLRSWYITGHDIEREFYFFQLTDIHHLWNPTLYHDAYNACLSITILPTVLTHLLMIEDMYVYKVIFQILFATASVIVFFLMKHYTTPVLAFLSVFFLMSFPTFFNDMPMLNRQEIGFLFFGLVLYVMLLPELSLAMRRILFSIFACAVVVSHYSTDYVLLALVLFVYVLTLIISLPFVKKIFASRLPKPYNRVKETFPGNVFLSLPLLVMLLAMTYIWNNVYTNSSNHAGSVLLKVVTSVFIPSKADTKSSDLSYSIFSSSKINPEQQLQQYIQSTIQAENYGSAENPYTYSKAITSKYPTYPVSQEKLAPTPLGAWLSSLHIPVFDIQAELRSLSAYFMQFFVFIGLLAIVFFKQKKPFDLQYLLLCFGAIFLLILETLLPALSVEYGLLRMFEQLLFLLALPIVLGLSSIFFFVKEQKRILLVGIIAAIFFLNLTGFISHLTGDYYPQMTLDNSGLYYDAYYVHKSDVLAIIWLSKNNGNKKFVEAGLPGINKLLTYGHINALNEIFPPVIRKDAYVYLETSSNTVVSIDQNVMVFNSSKPFLDDNKNLVYSNGQDNIYK
ncbi:MAG: DUF2206 domain-containing protein [Ktedonobacteraceae bacterium]|nr:DUF2206 domain-containing protein [Ktedonobacteraceae bacterium]